MQRAIIIPEKEFENLKRDIVKEIHEFSKKGYGFKMMSRESDREIVDDMQVLGTLLPPIDRVFREYLGEVE